MSDLKAQEFYQLYRKKTIEAGYSPIGRQRFTGIIKTLSLIPETFDYIQNKANGVDSKPANCAIFDVMAMLPTTNDMETYKGHRSECFKGEYMFGLQTGIESCFEWIKDWIRAKADGNLP